MKDKRSLHLKVQEMCDCFATADPIKEMLHLESESDKEEGAVKWIGLALLHGINANAKKISVTRTQDGQITVMAKYQKSVLPSPGTEIGRKVFDVLREITHIEGDEGELPLSVGIRDSSIDVTIEVEQEDGEETVTIEFPKWKQQS